MGKQIDFNVSSETHRTIYLTLSMEHLPSDGDIAGLVDSLTDDDDDTLWMTDEDRMEITFRGPDGSVREFLHSNWDTSEVDT